MDVYMNEVFSIEEWRRYWKDRISLHPTISLNYRYIQARSVKSERRRKCGKRSTAIFATLPHHTECSVTKQLHSSWTHVGPKNEIFARFTQTKRENRNRTWHANQNGLQQEAWSKRTNFFNRNNELSSEVSVEEKQFGHRLKSSNALDQSFTQLAAMEWFGVDMQIKYEFDTAMTMENQIRLWVYCWTLSTLWITQFNHRTLKIHCPKMISTVNQIHLNSSHHQPTRTIFLRIQILVADLNVIAKLRDVPIFRSKLVVDMKILRDRGVLLSGGGVAFTNTLTSIERAHHIAGVLSNEFSHSIDHTKYTSV